MVDSDMVEIRYSSRPMCLLSDVADTMLNCHISQSECFMRQYSLYYWKWIW